MQQSCLC